MSDSDGQWLNDFLAQTNLFITTASRIPDHYELMIREQELAIGQDGGTMADQWDAVATHARVIVEAGQILATSAARIAAMIRQQFGTPESS
jgi:hypothetical protein